MYFSVITYNQVVIFIANYIFWAFCTLSIFSCNFLPSSCFNWYSNVTEPQFSYIDYIPCSRRSRYGSIQNSCLKREYKWPREELPISERQFCMNWPIIICFTCVLIQIILTGIWFLKIKLRPILSKIVCIFSHIKSDYSHLHTTWVEVYIS